MRKYKFLNNKLFCSLIIILMMLLSGCQLPSTSGGSKNSTNQSQLQNKITSSGNTNSGVYKGGIPAINTNFNTTGTAVKASPIAEFNNVFYYCNAEDNNKIYTMNTSEAADANSKTNSSVVQNIKKISEDVASEIIVTSNFIYYTNGSDSNKIYSMALDGTNKKKVVDERAYNLVMIGNYIYYIGENDILSVADVVNVKNFSFGVKTKCFGSDGSNIYYELDDSNGDAFYSMKIDGENNTKICDDEPISIAPDSGSVYYANGKETDSLYSENAGKRVKLSEVDCSSLTVDSGWIYYINKSDYSKLYKIKTDGTSNTKVCDVSFVKSYIISGSTIYFDRSINLQSIIYKVNK